MKRSIFFSLLAVLLASSCTVYERGSLDLSGEWESSLGACTLPGTTDENHLVAQDAEAPGADGPETLRLNRRWPFEGVVTYSKSISIPAEFAGKRLKLVMERTKPSVLEIDGVEIGRRGHIIAPHEYELPALSPGEHKFVITIDNSATSVPAEIQTSHAWTAHTQTNWNGILGDFLIEAVDSTYISDLKIRTTGSKAEIEAVITAKEAREAELVLKAGKLKRKIELSLAEGENIVATTLDFGKDAQSWSEFHPTLYQLEASLQAGECRDRVVSKFGLREFSTEGTQFTINGLRTFLRGKHDACVFPLVAHVPTDVETWKKTFQKAKEYGINHYRFHSYTPTEAALEAADELGIYLQCELPFWGSVDPSNTALCDFLHNEGELILRKFANHPSFVMMGLGNELNGDIATMRSWIEDFRSIDPTKLYCFGSNNFIGAMGPQQGEDYFVAAKNVSSEYSAHLRGSMALCDALDNGILNATRPNTKFDFSSAMDGRMPCIGHEIGQYQVYPAYSEIDKYTGVLAPENLIEFKRRMMETFGTDRSAEFQNVTGQWALLCYKADMEAALRTPGFGGFQLLDLQDFPGQGTALVGILDAFMDEKGIDGIERWHESCAPVVVLARFEDYNMLVGDTFKADIQIANFSEEDWSGKLSWSFGSKEKGVIDAFAPQGGLADVGSITLTVAEAGVLPLRLESGSVHNTYELFAYEPTGESASTEIEGVTIDLSSEIGGLFIPDFWNWEMFQGICESQGFPVSPGTMGIIPSEEFSALFPCTGHSDWNWWSILFNSRPAVLDGRTDCEPIVEMVDNLQRAHRLAVVYRQGDKIVCTTDLSKIAGTVEGDAYIAALRRLASK